MSLPPPRLRHGILILFAAGNGNGNVLPGCLLSRRSFRSCGAYCLFPGPGPGRNKQDDHMKALENARKTGFYFYKWGMQIERRQQIRGRPGAGGPAAGGGGGSPWFRLFTSGGFWDAAKQTLITILAIIVAFFLIANFNVLIAAAINSLLLLLRQIRQMLSFITQCIFQGKRVQRFGTKSITVDSASLAGVPVKERVGMSARERVVRKWGID